MLRATLLRTFRLATKPSPSLWHAGERWGRPRAPAGRSAMERPRPAPNIGCRPQVPSSPTIDRDWEIRPPPELLGPLLAHADNLSDLNDSKELPPPHSS
jgi:hypothetical protein